MRCLVKNTKAQNAKVRILFHKRFQLIYVDFGKTGLNQSQLLCGSTAKNMQADHANSAESKQTIKYTLYYFSFATSLKPNYH